MKPADLRRGGVNATGAGLFPIDRDPLAQTFQILFAGLAAHLDQVDLLHTGSGASELVGHFAVVGYEQQALAHVVEAADRVESLAHLGEELHDGGAAFGIADCSDEAFGLIEHEVAVPFGTLQELAVDANVVVSGIGLGAQLGDNLAVHLDATLRNELFGMTPAGDAGLGEDFLKAIELGGRRLLRASFFSGGGFGGFGSRLPPCAPRLLKDIAGRSGG